MALEPAGIVSMAGLLDQRTSTPTVLRMGLGLMLRGRREQRGVSAKAAARLLGCSVSKISRLETGRGRFQLSGQEVAKLLAFYGENDPRMLADVQELVQRANRRGWWLVYADLMPGWFEMFVGLESSASMVRIFEAFHMPGLLQTEGYARALMRAGVPMARSEEVGRRITFRRTRQEALTRTHGALKLWVVIDESVLLRRVGGKAVMIEQLEHVLAMMRRPNVVVQVLPFDADIAAHAGGPITLLRFQAPDMPDVVYLEQADGAEYLDETSRTETYLRILDNLSAVARTKRESRALIESAIARFRC
ncbi:helix-turn-helix domain-containing protein [Streptomyces sp. URMC 129]|uniref:helix-turn-helix domain-containing protein n=1 Tax=Streptomyces sp. URMC 129 TaxID=3423407 RepID=UPI003F1C9500